MAQARQISLCILLLRKLGFIGIAQLSDLYHRVPPDSMRHLLLLPAYDHYRKFSTQKQCRSAKTICGRAAYGFSPERRRLSQISEMSTVSLTGMIFPEEIENGCQQVPRFIGSTRLMAYLVCPSVSMRTVMAPEISSASL